MSEKRKGYQSMRMCSGALAAASGLVLSSAATAASIDLGFTRVEPHDASVNPASQLKVSVSDVSGQPGQVTFKFTNTAVIYSSITEIYFDSRGSSPLSSLFSSIAQSGASFDGGGASPGSLPGGNNVGFVTKSSFSADAGSGGPSQGIDTSSDWVQLKFSLASGKTFADVVSAINAGDLRMGLHVKAIGASFFSSGDSDSFVNTVTAVPLPPAAMLGAGLMGALVVRRVRNARRA